MKKILYVIFFLSFFQNVKAQFFGKKEKDKVQTATAKLASHPDSISLTIKDVEIYYFLDVANKRLFVGTKEIFKSIRDYLPEKRIEDRYVKLELGLVDAFINLKKSDLKSLGNKLGLPLKQLRNMETYKIFSWSLEEEQY